MPTTVFNNTSLSFLPPVWNISQQQYSTHQDFSISSGNVSSPGSSSSSSSSTSGSIHESFNSPIRSPDTTTVGDVSGGDRPFLEILEQPYDKFRFRYITEMQGTHGAIHGANSQKSRKTFPRVKLHNYRPKIPGKLVIRCRLYTADEEEHKRTAHVHRLVGKSTGQEDDPHDIVIKSPNYTAIFQNMTILFTKKDDQLDVLVNKKRNHSKKMFTDDRSYSMLNNEELRTMATSELENMNLNLACLRFDALVDGGNGLYETVCPPVYSKPINNLKNALTNELKICRMDRCMGSCEGKEEVFIFVEKVVKKNIKVRFYEENENKEIVWCDYAEFSPEDVHHQFGIAFRTPPYRDQNIKENVQVYFQLERPSDGKVSEPRAFEYKPNQDRLRELKRKRPRQSDTSCFPTTVLDFQAKQQSNPITTPVINNIPVPSTFDSNLNGFSQINFSEIELMEDSLLRDLFDISVITDVPMGTEIHQDERTHSISSSNPSLTHVLEKLPTPDSNLISEFLKSGFLEEYARVNNEVEAAQRIMSNQVSSSGQMDLVFDGPLSFSGEERNDSTAPKVKPSHHAEPSDIDYADHRTLMSNMTKKNPSPRELLSERRKSCRLHNLSTPVPQPLQSKATSDTIQLKEDNIVKHTERTLKNLLQLFKSKKLTETHLQDLLVKLFGYCVGHNEDSVFHILAASSTSSLQQVYQFINTLKLHKVCNQIINKKNNKEETPLHVAVRMGTPDMVSLLLTEGEANVNVKNLKNNTPMHLAVLRDEVALDVVAVLLPHQPDLTIFNKDGLNVLHLAVSYGKSDIVSLLLMNMEEDQAWFPNSLINEQDRKHGNTALHIAVVKRCKEIINMLINFEKLLDIDAKNFSGNTPLALVWNEEDKESKEIQATLLTRNANSDLVESKKAKKYEWKYESDSDEDVTCLAEDGGEEDYSSAYARAWGATELFDKATIAKLCPVLDENKRWLILAKKIKCLENEIAYIKDHWSPSLLVFKHVSEARPEVTAEVIRDHLLTMGPSVQCCVQYIDDMLLEINLFS